MERVICTVIFLVAAVFPFVMTIHTGSEEYTREFVKRRMRMRSER